MKSIHLVTSLFIQDSRTTGLFVVFSRLRLLEITFSAYPRAEDLIGPE